MTSSSVGAGANHSPFLLSTSQLTTTFDPIPISIPRLVPTSSFPFHHHGSEPHLPPSIFLSHLIIVIKQHSIFDKYKQISKFSVKGKLYSRSVTYDLTNGCASPSVDNASSSFSALETQLLPVICFTEHFTAWANQNPVAVAFRENIADLKTPLSHSSDTSSSTSSALTCFTSLPLEIQIKIWEAFPEPRIVEVHALVYATAEHTVHLTYISKNPVPAILHVCSESRRVGLKYYTLEFGNPWDISNDGAIRSMSTMNEIPYILLNGKTSMTISTGAFQKWPPGFSHTRVFT